MNDAQSGHFERAETEARYDAELNPLCDRCPARAHWSICNLEGSPMQPIVRWFACGRHLHRVLLDGDWEVDSVHLYDVSEPFE